ncbi:MAG TPA: class II aldolase/adducin family protein, partial [Gammaproteobacteria bacterium]
MKSLWNDKEAGKFQGDLALRVYTSRLLGQDTSLVLHGGGNTSVKIREKNILGDDEELLYVKGSGWDLVKIEEGGFSPVRLQHLIELAKLPSLSDLQMVNELRSHMTNANAPTPSVEAILHAILPYKYVDHTHADAVISVTNTKDGCRRIKDIFGDRVVVIPYIMPGFDLTRLCAEIFPQESTKNTIGMVLMNHGIFSFGETAKISYERMIELVSRAEEYLDRHNSWHIRHPDMPETEGPVRIEIAALRLEASQAAGFPMLMATHRDHDNLGYVHRDDITRISQQGPATPDHVIRTKRVPLIGRDISNYVQKYKDYFSDNAPHSRDEKFMLDPAPRVILDKILGLCALGRNIKDADIVADIYKHTIDIILRSEMLGGYQALPAQDIFDVEYWELEQAKLRKSGTLP